MQNGTHDQMTISSVSFLQQTWNNAFQQCGINHFPNRICQSFHGSSSQTEWAGIKHADGVSLTAQRVFSTSCDCIIWKVSMNIGPAGNPITSRLCIFVVEFKLEQMHTILSTKWLPAGPSGLPVIPVFVSVDLVVKGFTLLEKEPLASAQLTQYLLRTQAFFVAINAIAEALKKALAHV